MFWRLDGKKVSADDGEVDGGLEGGMGRKVAATCCKGAIPQSAVKLLQTYECGACHTWKSEWCLQLISYSTGFFHTVCERG